jgi:hypothetical protein
VYFYDPRRQAYVPLGHSGALLDGDSALATVLEQEVAPRAVLTDPEYQISRLLPRAERLWLERQNVSALAPIPSAGADRPSGFIAFGPRRDAIGYSRHDEQFVRALASATGITVENLRLKAEAVGDEADGTFGSLCSRCHRVMDFDETRATCPCGGKLQAAAVPRRINAKFLVDAMLGEGGMGVVYLGTDIALNRQVAIKTLPSASADALSRLGREARTMAALSHPNLATILGYESWRGTPILVCEYLAGGTLQHRLSRGPLAIDQALGLGLTVLDALDYMHKQDVLHRDIKPSNIGFSGDGTLKLLDFGIAGLMEAQSSTGSNRRTAGFPTLGTTNAGTLAYLPPQAFEAESPTPFFDLWGLAVVLFESIVGRHPFAAGADTGHNICRGTLVAPLASIANLPEEVLAFFRNALSPDPKRQYGSSMAMREALTALRRTPQIPKGFS